MLKRSAFIGLLLAMCIPSISFAGQDGGYDITSELWAKAVLEVADNPITLRWKMVGADITPSGDQVVSGYFYADPGDFSYGSQYNPEVFVKIYIAANGWCNMAFNHVTVDDVSVYSMSGGESQSSTATLNTRLVEHQYSGVSIDSSLQTTGETINTSSNHGYILSSGLWAKAVLQPSKGAVNLIWKEVGTDTTPIGDLVVSGYFYASPEDFSYGSPYNPEVFVKVYISTNGWCNMAFNHVTVDDVRVDSAHAYNGTPDQTGTASLDSRLLGNQYNGVAISTEDDGSGSGTAGGVSLSVDVGSDLLFHGSDADGQSYWFYGVKDATGIPEYIYQMKIASTDAQGIPKEELAIFFDEYQRPSRFLLPDLQGEMAIEYVSETEATVTITTADGGVQTLQLTHPYTGTPGVSILGFEEACDQWAGSPGFETQGWAGYITICDDIPWPRLIIERTNSTTNQTESLLPSLKEFDENQLSYLYTISFTDDFEKWETYCNCLYWTTVGKIVATSIAGKAVNLFDAVMGYVFSFGKDIQEGTLSNSAANEFANRVNDKFGPGVYDYFKMFKEAYETGTPPCSRARFNQIQNDIKQPLTIRCGYSKLEQKTFNPATAAYNQELPAFDLSDQCAEAIYSYNLIKNPGAEEGPHVDSPKDPICKHIENWGANGSYDCIQTYDAFLEAIAEDDRQVMGANFPPPQSGSWLFTSWGNGTGSYNQTIDVSAAAADIDAGKVTCRCSAWMGGLASLWVYSPPVVEFNFSVAPEGGDIQLNGLTREEMEYKATMKQFEETRVLAPGTRLISVRVTSNGANSFIDNVSLILEK